MNTCKVFRWSVPALALASACFLGCGSESASAVGAVLTSSTELAAGDATCPAGGRRIDAGIDKNEDGVLTADEISSTSYVCSGADTGAIVIQKSDEPAGENCAAGGIKVVSGFDANADGTLTGAEILSTTYICGAEHPLTVSLDEPAGENCEFGGIRLDMGNDANGDGALAADEISSTAYTCFDETQANAMNAAAFISSMDNLLLRLYGASTVWSANLYGEMPWRSQAPNSYLEYMVSMSCALTDAYMDMSMNMSSLNSAALSTTANLAQEIREGRLAFDAAAFNRDFDVLNDNFMLCSGATFEKILTKFNDLGLNTGILFVSDQYGEVSVPPSIIFESLSGMLSKNYLRGNVADGSTCYFSSECVNANSACISLADDDGRQSVEPMLMKCSIGVCIPLKAAGEACQASSECYDEWCYNPNQNEYGVCTHLTTTTTIGDTCGYVSPGQFVGCGETVEDDYYCAYTNNSDATGTCVYTGDAPDETVGLGEDCTDYGCDTGLYCKETYENGSEEPVSSVCTAQFANGAKCIRDEECLSDFCYHENGANEGVCWETQYAELGDECGLVRDFTAAYCRDGLSVCLTSSGNVQDDVLRRKMVEPGMPTEKGKCVFRGNLGLAVGESCTATEECLDSWSGMTACMGPDRTALEPDASGKVAGTCQYVGDIGDKCSNVNAPKVNVCKRPLECNNTTGLCQELPSAGSAPSVNYPYCNPLNSTIARDLRTTEMPPPVCEPLLDAGEAVNPESLLSDSTQCKSHYALNGICLDSDVSFYMMLESANTMSIGGMSPCALEYLFNPDLFDGLR